MHAFAAEALKADVIYPVVEAASGNLIWQTKILSSPLAAEIASRLDGRVVLYVVQIAPGISDDCEQTRFS